MVEHETAIGKDIVVPATHGTCERIVGPTENSPKSKREKTSAGRCPIIIRKLACSYRSPARTPAAKRKRRSITRIIRTHFWSSGGAANITAHFTQSSTLPLLLLKINKQSTLGSRRTLDARLMR